MNDNSSYCYDRLTGEKDSIAQDMTLFSSDQLKRFQSQGLWKMNYLLKESGPIASDFFQTFRDFGIRRKLIFFSLPLVNFGAENVLFGRY